MPITGRLVDEERALAPYLAEWDELAIAARRPCCLPAWMLAWWRHASPPGAQLRVVLAVDGDRLVGVAPFYTAPRRARPTRYALLGAGAGAPVEPLAVTGAEHRVAQVFARALATAWPAPRLVELEGVAATSPWPALLGRAWPGGPPRAQRDRRDAVPLVTLDGSNCLDDWLGTKSASFRREMRRSRRRLRESGSEFHRAATAEQLRDGLNAFARLHYANWASRGGSAALSPAIERMLHDAGLRLLDSGRFRLWSVQVNGATIAAQIALASGGDLMLWLSGFDSSWAKHSPALQSVLATIEDALDRRERRVLLGPGDQDWKRRFADAAEAVESVTLVPSGAGAPPAWADVLARAMRRRASERLPPHVKGRIKAALRRARPGDDRPVLGEPGLVVDAGSGSRADPPDPRRTRREPHSRSTEYARSTSAGAGPQPEVDDERHVRRVG